MVGIDVAQMGDAVPLLPRRRSRLQPGCRPFRARAFRIWAVKNSLTRCSAAGSGASRGREPSLARARATGHAVTARWAASRSSDGSAPIQYE